MMARLPNVARQLDNAMTINRKACKHSKRATIRSSKRQTPADRHGAPSILLND
jgi:hypothetical protein